MVKTTEKNIEIIPGGGLSVSPDSTRNQIWVAQQIAKIATQTPDQVQEDVPTKTIATRVFLHQAQEIQYIADQLHVTVSELMREAIFNFVDESLPFFGLQRDSYHRLLNHDGAVVILDVEDE